MENLAVLKVYNHLKNDPEILSLLGLEEADEFIIEDRICKTRQVGVPNDESRRLAIWEDEENEVNRRVNRHLLVVDVIVTLEDQRSTGVAHLLLKRLKEVLHNAPIGTGLKFKINRSDIPILLGWYKAQAIFTYNMVGK